MRQFSPCCVLYDTSFWVVAIKLMIGVTLRCHKSRPGCECFCKQYVRVRMREMSVQETHFSVCVYMWVVAAHSNHSSGKYAHKLVHTCACWRHKNVTSRINHQSNIFFFFVGLGNRYPDVPLLLRVCVHVLSNSTMCSNRSKSLASCILQVLLNLDCVELCRRVWGGVGARGRVNVPSPSPGQPQRRWETGGWWDWGRGNFPHWRCILDQGRTEPAHRTQRPVRIYTG